MASSAEYGRVVTIVLGNVGCGSQAVKGGDDGKLELTYADWYRPNQRCAPEVIRGQCDGPMAVGKRDAGAG